MRRFVLKTLSPVHIGGRTQELTPLEALVYKGSCYVVSESALGRTLLKESKLDKLSEEINKQGPRFNLESFLKSIQLLNEETLWGIAAYRCATGERNTPGRLRPFVRDAYNRPFIPGSSLKGVLRTAVMYGYLKGLRDQNPGEFQRLFTGGVRRKLEEFLSAEDWKRVKPWFKDNTKRKMASQIESALMQRYELPVPGSPSKRGPTWQQKDIMRAIKISDTTPLAKDSLTLEEVQVISLTGGNEVYLKTPIYVEVIPPGTEMEFTVTLDEHILGDFSARNRELPFKSLDEVLSHLAVFAADIWEFDRNYWNGIYGPGTLEMTDFYRQEAAGMRLGWGSGLGGASLLLLLPENLRRELRDALFEPRGQFSFPKSRRAVMDGDTPRWPLGWVTIA